jgi:hypothetical protein
MKRLSKLSKYYVFAFLFLLFTQFSQAKTFYISSSYNGTTSNGSLLTPWKTMSNVQSALSGIAAGDSVLFKKGDRFSGSIVIQGKTGIYFGTYGTGEAPLFWGNGATIGTMFMIRSSSNLVFNGFNISDTTISSTDRTVQAKIQIAFTIEQSSRNNQFLNCKMERIGYGFYITSTSPGQKIDGCEISNLRMIKNTPTSVNPDDDYGGVPVQMSSSNNIFTNNYLHDCWSQSYDYGYDGGGVEFFEEGAVIENNQIAYNTFYDCNGTFEHGSNSDGVANNPIRNNKIYYNKFINCSSLFYINNSGQYKTAVTNLQFYNNILVQNVLSRTGNRNICSMALSETTPGIVVFKNNIFQVSNGASMMRSGQWTGGQFVHENNIYKISGGGALNFTLSSSELNSTQDFWQNTISSNPSQWDFHLLPNSQPINLGQSVSLSRDFEGTSISGQPDLGIFEFTAGNVGGATLSASASVTPMLCYAGTTSVVISATGGTAPYSGTGTFAHGVGTYTYIISDATGARDTVQAVVTQPTVVTPNIVTGTIAVAGGTTTITTTATGGTGTTYQYNINGSAYQNSGTFNNIGAGTYNVTAKDQNGCIGARIITITEPAVAALAATSSVGSISCNGGTTTVTISATGGVPPYTGTGSFTASAGTRAYTVTDSRGTSTTVSVSVTQPTAVTVTLSSGTIAQNGGTTTITATTTGGTGTSYQYNINGSAFQTSGTFNNISAGTYNVTAKDQNGCIGTRSITITEPAVATLTAASSVGSILCNGGTTTVTISATGGVPPYTGTGSFTASAGTRAYTVTDSRGTSTTVSVSVSQPTAITFSTSSGSITTQGGSTSIIVNATGGTVPYVYSIDGGSYQTSNQFTGVGEGAHTISVKDANGCIKTGNTTIATPIFDSLKVTATTGTITCFGGTAPVTLTAIGGNGPYTGTGTFFMSAGTRIFTVIDATGAISNISVTLTQPTDLVVLVNVAADIQTIGGTTSVTFTATGGVGPYLYSLDGGVSQTSNTFRSVTGGSHTISVVDQNGCIKIIPFVVNTSGSSLNPLRLSILSKSDATCRGARDGKVEVLASGGRPPYQYAIGNGSYGINNMFFNLKAGYYRIRVRDANQTISSVVVQINDGRRSCNRSMSGGNDDNGVEAIRKTETIVYPNPSNSDFTIKINADSDVEASVEIIDIYGKKLMQSKARTGTSIKMGQQLKSGIYFVRVIIAGEVTTTKVIKL